MIDRSKILLYWKKRDSVNKRAVYDRFAFQKESHLHPPSGSVYAITDFFLKINEPSKFEWYVRSPTGPICNSGYAITLEEAFRRCDIALERTGWILLDERTESLL